MRERASSSTRLQVETIIAFFDPGMLRELLHRRRQLRLGDRKPLPHLQRRGAMVHSDELKGHGAMNL